MKAVAAAAILVAGSPLLVQCSEPAAPDGASGTKVDPSGTSAPMADHAAMDHSKMGHAAMGHADMNHMSHGTAEADHGGMDHASMNHPASNRPAMDHGSRHHAAMTHSGMDHSAVKHAAPKSERTSHAGMNHGAMNHAAMNHAAMGHQAKPRAKSASTASDQSAASHATMDHSAMDHATMDHSTMDHSAHAAATGPAPADPHAGHDMPAQAGTAPVADPHAGHDMTAHSPTPATDPHAGHDMTAQAPAAPAADPHAGHDMTSHTSDAAPDAAHAADPHAGHDMTAQAPAAPVADPHAGHDMASHTPDAAADPHAGHAMGATAGSSSDAHAGHNMATSDPHVGHNMATGEATIPQGPPPAAALSGPAHAADTIFPPDVMAATRVQIRDEMGGMIARNFLLDRLELQSGKGSDTVVWDANAWIGSDIDKLWIKSEGEVSTSGEVEEAEVQALWSHAIGPWTDLQGGVRYDIRPLPDRGHIVLGVQGLAPYFIEYDAAAFLSHKGEVTGRIEAEYDQRITQRLIAQPRIEANLSAQDIPELGLGSGLTSVQAGVRVRYEFVREFAPYIGVEWQREFGDTARFTRAAGEDPDRVVLVAGVRAWF